MNPIIGCMGNGTPFQYCVDCDYIYGGKACREKLSVDGMRLVRLGDNHD